MHRFALLTHNSMQTTNNPCIPVKSCLLTKVRQDVNATEDVTMDNVFLLGQLMLLRHWLVMVCGMSIM